MKRLITLLIFGILLTPILLPANALMQSLNIRKEPFVLKTDIQDHQLYLNIEIAPQYHLYKQFLRINTTPNSQATIGQYTLPVGIPDENDLFGKHEIYREYLKLPIPITARHNGFLSLVVHYQGCKGNDFCLPPTNQTLTLTLPSDIKIEAGKTLPSLQTVAPPAQQSYAEADTQDESSRYFSSDHNVIWILLSFFGAGLLLAFTPCVLPMLPILSAIILGQGKATTTRALRQSTAFVLGSAITYTIFGIVAAALGESLQAKLQTPPALLISATIFVLLALSAFGLFNIRLPSALELKLQQASQNKPNSGLIHIIIMGAISALIVSPCVTAPLIGALTYITTTGDTVLGGAALFCLALGMGLPLILICTLGTSILPKRGNWMNHIKTLSGVMLLGVAIWLIARIIDFKYILMLSGATLIGYSLYLGAFDHAKSTLHKIGKGIGLICFIYGTALCIGGLMGNHSFTEPLRLPNTYTHAPEAKSFIHQAKVVLSLTEINQEIAAAKAKHQPTVLDFYADWCAECKHVDKVVFGNPDVIKALQNAHFVKVDMTLDNTTSQAVAKHFKLFGYPAILMFNPQGNITRRLSGGDITTASFLQALAKAHN